MSFPDRTPCRHNMVCSYCRTLAIQEPYYKQRNDGSLGIRVDDPSEIVDVSMASSPSDFKALGNKCFQAREHQGALDFYKKAIETWRAINMSFHVCGSMVHLIFCWNCMMMPESDHFPGSSLKGMCWVVDSVQQPIPLQDQTGKLRCRHCLLRWDMAAFQTFLHTSFFGKETNRYSAVLVLQTHLHFEQKGWLKNNGSQSRA